MKRPAHDRLRQALSIAFAAMPFAFALIRGFRTGGHDLRYLWVALAAFCGTTAIITIARPHGGNGRRVAAALSAAVFAAATVSAVMAGRVLGTMVGPGLLVVAASFGFCFAVFGWLHVRARP